MMKHKWNFKSRFRREAYGWKGTALASKRMREAVSDIKKVARKDPCLAAEGVVELFCRLYPALMMIDSSSGALGTAIGRTIDGLVPILVKADWPMKTRGKWLQRLYGAIQEDGWGTFDSLRDRWGELCVYPDLAHLWADELLPRAKDVFTSEGYAYSVATDMCLSCLLYTERYEEICELLQLQNKPFWNYNKFWAMALTKQGKIDEAIEYARSMQQEDRESVSINLFCEDTLLEAGRIDEAYEKYGMKVPLHGTYLNIYRGICNKYPTIDRRKILLDCMRRTVSKGSWFAAAKDAGFRDIALECAEASGSNPDTLLRACRDFAQKDVEFSLEVGIQGILKLITETFYEEVMPFEVNVAYDNVEKIAVEHDRLEKFKARLGRVILRRARLCKPRLREALVNKLESG